MKEQNGNVLLFCWLSALEKLNFSKRLSWKLLSQLKFVNLDQ